MVYTKNYLLATMRVMFGGRIAEEVFFNEISSGAASDIKQATDIAKRMVREWGMGDATGFLYFGDEENQGMFDMGGREYSDKTAELIDVEMKRLVDTAYAEAKKIVKENRQNVENVAKALLQYETISGEEVNAVIRGESLERTSVSDLLDIADGESKPPIARPIETKDDPKTGLDSGTLPQPG